MKSQGTEACHNIYIYTCVLDAAIQVLFVFKYVFMLQNDQMNDHASQGPPRAGEVGKCMAHMVQDPGE